MQRDGEIKMTQTTARIKKNGKEFEILVDLENSMNLKKGLSTIQRALEMPTVFTDSKKGLRASTADLKAAFGTDEPYAIAEIIIRQGEVLLTQDFRDAAQEEQIKKVVDALVRNAVDARTGMPYTPDRIRTAMQEAHVQIKNRPVEEQLPEIIEKLSPILPIKVQKKRIRITIPAMHTGKVYGLIAGYKESEEWKNNGDLVVVVGIPAGLQLEFYDKLNSMTHGAALTEEMKE